MPHEPQRADVHAFAGPSRAVLVGLTTLGVLVIGLNAWLCDDAFITLRSAKHLVEGYGPVFNVGWRVQSYTDPAWMLLLALAWAITREAFWTTIIVALVVSAAALGLGLRSCRGWTGALVCVAAAISSRAFVEFSTGGLENPLTHLVIAGAVALSLREGEARRRLIAAGLLTSAAFLCRPDAILFLAPTWLAFELRARAAGLRLRERVGAWLLGATPMLAWELFSLIYYGALIPNTALAKLPGSIPRSEMLERGLNYVWRPASDDPPTFLLMLIAVVVPWLNASASKLRPLALGVLAYLAYVIWIGGDYMLGRFLTVPAWVGALVLGQVIWSKRAALLVAPAWLLVSALGARHPLWPDAGGNEHATRDLGGMKDERRQYAAASSVLAWRPGRDLPEHPWREAGEQGPPDGARVVWFSTMGFYGYYADTELHIVDHFALADPLLAQLAPVRRVKWRAGHMARVLPEGYMETLAGDPWAVQIRDPGVAHLYEVVARVHHGPVFASGRARAIFELLSGRASAGVDQQAMRFAELVRVNGNLLPNTRQLVRFRDAGVEIQFDATSVPDALVLLVSPGQRYAFIFTDAEGHELERRELELEGEWDGPGATIELSNIQPGTARLHVLPLTMHHQRSLALGGAALAER